MENQENKTKQEKIHDKGFYMKNSSAYPSQYSNVKIGNTSLVDPVTSMGSISAANPNMANISQVLTAIEKGDLSTLRGLSEYFYRVSGIYSRLCKYIAFLYKYDWVVTPYIGDSQNQKKIDKIIKDFDNVLRTLDNFGVKMFFGEVALKVAKSGAYYGYLVRGGDGTISVQELPLKYCRSRFSQGGVPVVEFDMGYFDTTSRDAGERLKILKLFPKEFMKGYLAFKEGKLSSSGSKSGWWILDTELAFKFNLNGQDSPMFISVIKEILELDEAKALDKKAKKKKLNKIISQKIPLDKNNELIFDIDEVQELHNNVKRMLSSIEGADVLTSFADITSIDMSDKAAQGITDDLMRSERSVYNESGTAQNLFNTDGNLALDKSVANDEASIVNLIYQFERFLNFVIKPFNKNIKQVEYRVSILPTTIYNYKDLAKLYKEQTQLGYSKMLPQIALGQSQRSILATAYFENDVLDLVNAFIPPMSSNTMSSADIKSVTSDSTGGRPQKDDGEKSDKTIANQESMN